MICVLTLGGDPLTTETIEGAEADTARTAVDGWWVRQTGCGRVLLGTWLAGPTTSSYVRSRDGSWGSLTRELGNFDLAEECVQDAIVEALKTLAGGRRPPRAASVAEGDCAAAIARRAGCDNPAEMTLLQRRLEDAMFVVDGYRDPP